MSKSALEDPSRRAFVLTAPVAAATGFAIMQPSLFALPPEGPAPTFTPTGFLLFNAETIAKDLKALDAAPGNNNLFDPTKVVPLAVVLTTEKEKTAPMFEWHEGRDHVLQILEGETVYEVGGTPKNGHSIRPGEWLAPEAEGSTKITLKKGDMLIIPRGTLHKRSTAKSVTLSLISSSGVVKS